jgi:hypothetical protein
MFCFHPHLRPFGGDTRLLGLASAFRPWVATLDSLRLRSLDMVGRYPLFIIALSTRRHRRPIRPQSSGRFPRIDFLGATCLLGFLATSAALLREIRGYPDAVEQIEDSTGTREHEEVEEDTCNNSLAKFSQMIERDLHLRIKYAGIRLNNADRLIESLQGKIFAVTASDDSS